MPTVLPLIVQVVLVRDWMEMAELLVVQVADTLLARFRVFAYAEPMDTVVVLPCVTVASPSLI